MIELKKDELLKIEGGAWYSAAFFNAAARIASTLMDMGRSLGSAIRRALNGTFCPI